MRFDGFPVWKESLMLFSIGACAVFPMIAIRLFFRNVITCLLIACPLGFLWGRIIWFTLGDVTIGSKPVEMFVWQLVCIVGSCVGVGYLAFCHSTLIEQSDNRRGQLGILTGIFLAIWISFFLSIDPVQFCRVLIAH